MALIKSIRDRLQGRTTVKAHLWQSLANYVQQGFGLIYGIVLARILIPEDFGHYGYAYATVVLCLLPANWSLGQALVADSGRTPGFFRNVAAFTWTMCALRMLIVVGLICWGVVKGDLLFAKLTAIIGVVEAFRDINTIRRSWLEGQGIFRPNLYSAFSIVTCSVAIGIPAALLGAGPYAIALPGIACIISDFVIYGFFSNVSVWVMPGLYQSGRELKTGFWLWLSAVSEIGMLRFDKWFIGTHTGMESLGLYNRAFSYAPLNHMLLNSLVTNPTVVAFARAADYAARRRILLKTCAVLAAGSVFNWALFCLFSKPVVLTVFGPKWVDSIPLFEAFAPLSGCLAFLYIPTALLLASKQYKTIALIRAAGFGAFVIFLFLFAVQHPDANSVATWLQVAICLQGLACWYHARRQLAKQ